MNGDIERPSTRDTHDIQDYLPASYFVSGSLDHRGPFGSGQTNRAGIATASPVPTELEPEGVGPSDGLLEAFFFNSMSDLKCRKAKERKVYGIRSCIPDLEV